MAKSNGTPLRFAALVRVSTERQEKQGESLRTQRSQIESTVKKLGATVTRWYAGQEHATAGWEREQRDSMLAEAEKDRRPFDAVIVAHEDRWSRDDTRSGADLERLQRAGVRFFVLDREQDLTDPTVRLYLGMSALIGAYHSRNQRKKAFENRIERAKRNIPTCGKLPFARAFDKETGTFIVDKKKQAMIEDIAKRYLAGEGLWALASEYGQNHPNITRCLRERCGTTFTITFRSEELGIDETIPIKVPRLLPEGLIRQVCQRMDAKRTYLHGTPKNEYLLGGRVFCALCGCNLTGATSHGKDRYYRHNRKYIKCSLDPLPWVRADKLEAAVVRDVFNLLGNPAAIERAVKAAIPDANKAIRQRERLQADVAKIQKARDRVLSLIQKDAITDRQAELKLLQLKSQEAALLAKLDGLVVDVPDAGAIRRALHLFDEGGVIAIMDDEGNEYAGGNSVQSFLLMSSADRRELVRVAFDGKLPDGKPSGVYITPTGGDRHGPKRFSYTLRGRLLCGTRRGLEFSCP